MKLINFIFLLVGFVNISEQYSLKVKINLCNQTFLNGKSVKTKIDGYYWRPFTGLIPTDAVPGGKTKVYKTTYIGLVYDPENEGEFITTIFPGIKGVVVTRKKTSLRLDHIQILCTENPTNVQWLTSAEHTNWEDTFIVGGSTKDNPIMFIGRAKTKDDEIYVGDLDDKGVRYTTSTGKPGLDEDYVQYKLLYDMKSISTDSSEEEEEKIFNYKVHTQFAYYWKPLYPLPDDDFSIETQTDPENGQTDSIKIAEGYDPEHNVMLLGTFDEYQNVINSRVKVGKNNFTDVSVFTGRILCTSDKHTFKWVKTTINTVTIHFPKAVLGGYMKHSPVYIARIVVDGNTRLAQVSLVGKNFRPEIDYNIKGTSTFEILTYEPWAC